MQQLTYPKKKKKAPIEIFLWFAEELKGHDNNVQFLFLV